VTPTHSHSFHDSPLPAGASVFIVEDDEAARHSLVASLESLGCTVKTYCSCEGFLKDAENREKGCLLLDFHFSGLSGLDMLDLLHEARIFIPTVLFTGRFGALLKRRASDYPEVVSVLDKPLGRQPLLDALMQASELIEQ
jgi:FixJ family two-component response regulator